MRTSRPRHGGYEPRQRLCGGKRRFDTEAEAERARDEQELVNMGLRLKVYRCSELGCNGWHLTRVDASADKH